ncbi:hypothetical protein [Erwinia tasmaniensis]|uniref:Uncharacterized protein n=1 Tax=Erwinia tasmaniensis (strain DSM 17950 / CFBP 7177 / CIP 109463 / NCPPB 4357 / Et1/99) TaxID=465817 RepID=B2VG33_ERWT9|nr:hypothetical protein [Erwinia tasmaniensis]CAO97722.1 hypothetical protein ETA_26760 [Erwinia tasmaniensis Et1/99]
MALLLINDIYQDEKYHLLSNGNYPYHRNIHIQISPSILILSMKEVTTRKAQFTERQTIAAMKSVEAVHTVKDVCR